MARTELDIYEKALAYIQAKELEERELELTFRKLKQNKNVPLLFRDQIRSNIKPRGEENTGFYIPIVDLSPNNDIVECLCYKFDHLAKCPDIYYLQCMKVTDLEEDFDYHKLEIVKILEPFSGFTENGYQVLFDKNIGLVDKKIDRGVLLAELDDVNSYPEELLLKILSQNDDLSEDDVYGRIKGDKNV